MKKIPLNAKFMGLQLIQRLRHSCYYLYEVRVAPKILFYKIVSSKTESDPYSRILLKHELQVARKVEESRAYNWTTPSLEDAINRFLALTNNSI